MTRSAAWLALLLVLCCAGPATAQTSSGAAKESAKESLRDRAIKRCRENRGTDCETEQGLSEWLRQEQPITDEERAAAVAARRYREKCQKDPKAAGC